MSNDLYSVDFTRLLPASLKEDQDILALGEVISKELQKVVHQIKENIIYARIDELEESLLDVLAYDLHVDWYDDTYSP